MVRFLKKLRNFSKIKTKKSHSSGKKLRKINWFEAKDVYSQLRKIISTLSLTHIKTNQLKVFRSYGSKARARARIWAFPRIWQLALNLPPYYVIEVISEKFDHLASDDKKRVLIHELMHIPKNFSGSLVSHRGRFHRINAKSVEQLFSLYKKVRK